MNSVYILCKSSNS